MVAPTKFGRGVWLVHMGNEKGIDCVPFLC